MGELKKGATISTDPWQVPQTRDYASFPHPHLPPHPVVKQQNMELRIVSRATGSFGFHGNKDPRLLGPNPTGQEVTIKSLLVTRKYTQSSAAPLVGGSEERLDFTWIDDSEMLHIWLQ
ncbi:hypothetical protein AVEN_72466-1 [Araneus ventricosus]|uniref:Uncharacterized protein n=1 Tax=Araneus ventricosus TaxID=182803 RepID=A0A4Y2TGP0_ARAVE|nr:hypothetical protein AVEN_72466-1 [Araneus ventricosus]